METYALRTRSIISTWLSLSFIVLLALYLVFIEFFQLTKNTTQVIDLLKSPIDLAVLNNISSIQFKNRIGSFLIKKDDKDWIMQEPRNMPANGQTIKRITTALKNIKIQTIHQHEPINFQSFSLDNPVVEMEITTIEGLKIIIKIGLINSINNTSYLTVSGHDHIYQTNLIDNKLQGLELSDFIDSHIFSSQISEIKKIEIYRGKSKEAHNIITRTQTHWITKKYKQINHQKLADKIQLLLDTKTHMIIDKKNEKLQNFINNYLKNPQFRVNIKLKNGKTIKYVISHSIKEIKDLKIEKKQYFLITASNRPYPYVISNSYYKNFKFRYADLKN